MILIILTSCRTQEDIQVELLHNLNINTKADFEALETCEQIKVYSIMASKYIDIDYMVTLVPIWMHETIAKQPRENVAKCVIDEITNLLSPWDENSSNKMDISYRIHSLLYLVDGLNLTEFSGINDIFYNVVCRHEIYDKEQLILILYTERFGATKFPTREEMLKTLCK
jgi:hypothetical protein